MKWMIETAATCLRVRNDFFRLSWVVSPVLTKLWFGKKVFFRKHKKKNYVVTRMVKSAACKHKEITWFHFCEDL